MSNLIDPTAAENKALVPSSAPLPAELYQKTAEDAGKGLSSKAEDQMLPLIYLLQTNSPQLDKHNSHYFEGAEAGDFFLKGALDPLHSGETGLEVINCGMATVWMEWRPGRQGYVDRHFKEPIDVENRMVQQDGQQKPAQVRRSNSNVIVETRELYLLVGGRPYILPCYGTRHTFAKEWQTYFHQFRHPQTGTLMPAFARKYLLLPRPASNPLGRWYGIKFEDLGWVSMDEYNLAKEFSLIVAKGKLRAEEPINGDI
jgi:hypothetical protein